MKTGLVVEGGGMKCAYTAGILDGMLDERMNFSYAIGVSAGSSCLASFLAGQSDRNRRFFVEYVNDPRYISFENFRKTGNYFGLDYIYGEMSNSDGIDPLDYPAFEKNKTAFQVVATDAKTALPHYFNKDDVAQDDYRVFMASCAIPAACKPVAFGDALYFDGGVSDPLPIRHATAEGCDRIVIVMCRPRDIVRSTQKHKMLLSVALRKYPDIHEAILYRHKYYNDSLQFARKLEAEGKVMIIAPKEALPVDTYTKDAAVLQGIYETARSDFEDVQEKLKEFLKG